MLKDNEVCACLPSKDMARSAKFYEDELGLKVVMSDPGGTFYASGNGGIFVYPSSFAGTNQATAAAWSVSDVAAAVDELKAKGVTFEHYEGMPNTKLEGDIHVMGDLKMAWFKDPDGNILNIVNMQAQGK